MNDVSAIGRNVFSHNPKLIETAFETVRKDSNFPDAADKALKSVLAVKASEANDTVKGSDLATPNLVLPTLKAQGELNSSGKLALLLGQLAALLGDVSTSEMAGRLATWTAMMNAQKAMGEQLSLELQTALEEFEQATETYQSALSSLKTSKAVLNAANKKLIQAQAKLDGLSPEDAGYTQALSAHDQATNESMRAKQKVEQAEKTAMEAHDLVKPKAECADKLLTQAQGLGVKNEMVQKGEQENLSGIAKLTLLMAMFVELIGKNGEKSLEKDLALFRALQDGRQKELDKKASEYQEEVRKSETLNYHMKWVGKLLGVLLAIGGVVAAAFTGGASLAFAVVGVALMVADEICQAASGVSFIQEALKPLMEKVLKPLMEVIGKAISKALEACGVGKKTADMVGAIAGAILAAVAMVVLIVLVAIVGKGAAAKLGSALSKLMGDAIRKIVPNVLKGLAKSKGTKLASRLNTVVRLGTVAHVSTQAAGNVSHGVFMKKASDAMADFSLAHAAMEQIQKCLTQMVEHFAESQKSIVELNKSLSVALQQHAEAGRFVLRQNRA